MAALASASGDEDRSIRASTPAATARSTYRSDHAFRRRPDYLQTVGQIREREPPPGGARDWDEHHEMTHRVALAIAGAVRRAPPRPPCSLGGTAPVRDRRPSAHTRRRQWRTASAE